MGLPPWETSDGQLFALVTGANSGLGHAIASRLINEFITSPSTPPNNHLVLVLCTRSPMKSRLTISRLRSQLRVLVESSAFAKALQKKAVAEGREYKWEDMVNKVHLLGVEADLCDLKSVYALADQLVNGTVGSPDATTAAGRTLPYGSPGTKTYSEDIDQHPEALSLVPGSIGAQRAWGWGLSGLRLPRLDVIALNAGIGGWTGVNWPIAIMDVLTNVIHATTWPRFKIGDIGALVKAQLPSSIPVDNGRQHDPPLGRVFCSNFFGHYLLAHELMPLLSRPASTGSQIGGKIIWISSIEAQPESLSIDDIQGLHSKMPYESSKRLTDLIALTSGLPSVKRISAPYYDSTNTVTSPSKLDGPLVKPRVYTTHPGVFNSDILPLPAILVFVWKIVAVVARWLGSPWHLGDPYKAAVAPVWVALADSERLQEVGDTSVKWGSAINSWGDERVKKTEVGGWGWEGKVGAEIDGEGRNGRHKKAVDLTEEAKAEFEVLGGQCWKQVEELRGQWEELMRPIVRKR